MYNYSVTRTTNHAQTMSRAETSIHIVSILTDYDFCIFILLAVKRICSKATKWHFDLIIPRNQLFCSSFAVLFSF